MRARAVTAAARIRLLITYYRYWSPLSSRGAYVGVHSSGATVWTLWVEPSAGPGSWAPAGCASCPRRRSGARRTGHRPAGCRHAPLLSDGTVRAVSVVVRRLCLRSAAGWPGAPLSRPPHSVRGLVSGRHGAPCSLPTAGTARAPPSVRLRSSRRVGLHPAWGRWWALVSGPLSCGRSLAGAVGRPGAAGRQHHAGEPDHQRGGDGGGGGWLKVVDTGHVGSLALRAVLERAVRGEHTVCGTRAPAAVAGAQGPAVAGGPGLARSTAQ